MQITVRPRPAGLFLFWLVLLAIVALASTVSLSAQQPALDDSLGQDHCRLEVHSHIAGCRQPAPAPRRSTERGVPTKP